MRGKIINTNKKMKEITPRNTAQRRAARVYLRIRSIFSSVVLGFFVVINGINGINGINVKLCNRVSLG